MAWSILMGLAVCLLAAQTAQAAYPISLEGFWRFELDTNDSGIQQQWFNRDLRNRIRLPGILQPVVWAIDDWNRNYKLGVIFECAVGDGKLLVSAIDVTKPDDRNPVARQLRYSLLNYMASDCFQPRIPVTAEDVRGLFFDTTIMKKLGATERTTPSPTPTPKRQPHERR